jgi:chromosomal replication initiator protein
MRKLIQTRIFKGCGRPVRERVRTASIERVIKIVSHFCGVAQPDLIGSDRTQHVAMVRQVAMYLARRHSSLSYPELGAVFRRDHSSIIHGVKAIEQRVQAQPAFAKFLAQLESAIRNENEKVAA